MKIIDEQGISVKVNAVAWSGVVKVNELLIDFLRTRLGLTGAKRACDAQVCGACTVLLDDKPVSACNVLAYEVDGTSVQTIEGLAQEGRLHPLQEAFVEHVAFQCGFCTPGQIMAAKGLLEANPAPDGDDIKEWMKGNICRCGSYPAILQAIRDCVSWDSSKNE